MSKKVFVLDTNVLLSDVNSFESFDEHGVIIPLVALEELDRHKKRMDEVGRNARHVSRKLDELRKQGNLADGILLPRGGLLRVLSDDLPGGEFPLVLKDRTKVDNIIIAFAKSLQVQHGADNVVVISKDINVRIKCDVVG